MKKNILFSIVILLTQMAVSQDCNYNRYNEQIFSNVTIHNNIVYGIAPELNPPSGFPLVYHEDQTTDINLLMDIYEPTGDTLSKRPMIVFIHGGAFLPGGTFHNEDMIAFCDTFARRGYVTATIEYRLGFNTYDADAGARAVYRAVQDGRAAIRFLKENASTYNIDTNNIFMLGSSAGGFVSLHNLFMNEENERPTATYNAPDLGCLDCTGNTYLHNSHPNAIVSLWGALQDTTLINLNDIKPSLLVHGTADDIVPFGVGSPFNSATLPPTYGSSPISLRLSNLGYVNPDNYFVTGEGHEFYGVQNGNFDNDGVPGPNAYWDTIVDLSSNFIYEQHMPYAYYSYNTTGLTVDFNDLSTNAIEWCWDFGDTYTSTEQNPSHTFNATGNYDVTLRVYNNIYSYNEFTYMVYVDDGGTVSVSSTSKNTFNIYPNPTNNKLQITSLTKQLKNNNILVFDITGKQLECNKQSIINSNTVSIDVSHLKKGIYFIKVGNVCEKFFKL